MSCGEIPPESDYYLQVDRDSSHLVKPNDLCYSVNHIALVFILDSKYE